MDRKIINLGVVAHVDAGKTTLTEQILFASGEIHSAGRVDKGSAHTDSLDVEKARGISVKSSAVQFEWKGCEINLIDTPGHMDFTGEIERSLMALDCAVVVVSAVERVQGQTEVVWKALESLGIPCIVFVNKMDRVGACLENVIVDMLERFGVKVVNFDGVDLDNFDVGCDLLIEELAENDDEIMMMFLDGVTADKDMIYAAAVRLFNQRKLFPLVSGVALQGCGVRMLLDLITCLYESRHTSDELSGIIYRIEHDPKLGKVSHVRLFDGNMSVRDVVWNSTKNVNEKITMIQRLKGIKLKAVDSLTAGEIGVVSGLGMAKIGDILGQKVPLRGGFSILTPLLRVQVFPKNTQEYQNLVAATAELCDEDPYLNMMWVSQSRELLINVTGIIQLEILEVVLKTRFGLDVSFGRASTIYKETPSSTGYGFESYTMPKPCWAVLKFLIEPLEPGTGVKYSSIVSNDKIYMRYQSQTEDTIAKALAQGPLGWEVTDIKITLVDGEHHIMHTHPLDFYVATPMAVMNGLVNTGTDLLEPIMSYKITVPEEYRAKLVNEIINMRGILDSSVITKGNFILEGTYPSASSYDFPLRLASLTSGKGMVNHKFLQYEKCPAELGETAQFRGVSPLDRAKYILHARNAL